MAKKTNLFSLYFIGMILIVVGFCLPMFGLGGGLMGGWATSNGFSFIGNKGTFVTIGAICIIAGGVMGILCSLGILGKSDMLKMVALLISIAGGIILVVGFNQNGLTKLIGKGFLKSAKIGFYLILAGWVTGIIGYTTSK